MGYFDENKGVAVLFFALDEQTLSRECKGKVGFY